MLEEEVETERQSDGAEEMTEVGWPISSTNQRAPRLNNELPSLIDQIDKDYRNETSFRHTTNVNPILRCENFEPSGPRPNTGPPAFLQECIRMGDRKEVTASTFPSKWCYGAS